MILCPSSWLLRKFVRGKEDRGMPVTADTTSSVRSPCNIGLFFAFCLFSSFKSNKAKSPISFLFFRKTNYEFLMIDQVSTCKHQNLQFIRPIVLVQVKTSQRAPLLSFYQRTLKSSNGNSVWRLYSDYSGKSHTPTGMFTEVRYKPTRSLLGRQLNPYLL